MTEVPQRWLTLLVGNCCNRICSFPLTTLPLFKNKSPREKPRLILITRRLIDATHPESKWR